MVAGIQTGPTRILERERFDVTDSEWKWVTDKLGTAPRYDEFDRLYSTYSGPEHRILHKMRNSLIGGVPLNESERVLASNGDGDTKTLPQLTLRRVGTPSGESPEIQKLRGDLIDQLLGHENELDSFVRMLKDFQSPARRNCPVMGLVGDPGHGKEPALEEFARSVFGKNGKVFEFNFAGVTNDDYDTFFGPRGSLTIDKLREEISKEGVIRIMGAEDLQKNAPRIAKRLATLLTSIEGEADYVRVHYFFDFDKGANEDPRLLLVSALGSAGNRVLSASSRFTHLDGPTMAKYALRRIPEIMQADRLKDLSLRYTPEALAQLGEALATPNEPLYELEARLLRFVLDKFDTQTSLQRDKGILRLTIADPFLRDEQARQQRLAALHKENPDLLLGGELFDIQVVGLRGLSDQARDRLVSAAEKAGAELQSFAAELNKASKSKSVDAVAKAARELGVALAGVVDHAKLSIKLGLVEMLTADQAKAVQAAAEAIRTAIDALSDEAKANPAVTSVVDQIKVSAAASLGVMDLMIYGYPPETAVSEVNDYRSAVAAGNTAATPKSRWIALAQKLGGTGNDALGKLEEVGFPPLSAPQPAGPGPVKLRRSANGHFETNIQINGHDAGKFIVDTGATDMALPTPMRDRFGLGPWQKTGEAVTASGRVPNYTTRAQITVGGHTHDLMVGSNDGLQVGLLGMSYLKHFEMHIDGDFMTLTPRHTQPQVGKAAPKVAPGASNRVPNTACKTGSS